MKENMEVHIQLYIDELLKYFAIDKEELYQLWSNVAKTLPYDTVDTVEQKKEKQHIEELSSSNQLLTQQINDLNDEIRFLHTELSTLYKENESMKERLKEKDSVNEQLQQTIHQLNTPIAKHKKTQETEKTRTTKTTIESEDSIDYSKMKVAELKQLCKQRHLLTTGTKPILISRLKHSKVFETLDQFKLPNVVLEKDEQGRLIHQETGFVFIESNDDFVVIGRQIQQETVALSDEDKDLCKEMNVMFQL